MLAQVVGERETLATDALDTLRERFGMRLAFASAQGMPAWRSRAPRDVTPSELADISRLRLGEVWDLRTADERAQAPGALVPGVPVRTVEGRLYPPNPERARREVREARAGKDVPSDDAHFDGGDPGQDIPGAPGKAGAVLARQLDGGRAGRRAPGERMQVIYRGMAESAEKFAPVVRALALAPAPALVFCTSGKDRTGVACYCAQRALGASHTEALAGYLATNEVNAQVNAADLAALRSRGVPAWRLEVARSLFEARPEYLETFVTGVTQAYGSFEAYLERCLRG